ncbi:MAG: sugar phosphate isomerase/epimerase [Thermoplasmata archaeon]|nr:sugar phosphate isomerase/epimerase [Thermoplasmata archaeon]
MIAVSSYTVVSRLSLEEAFELITEHFDGWEVVGEGVHTITEIRDELSRLMPSYDLQLSLHAPFSDINIGSFNAKIREEAVRQVVEAIHVAADLGMKTVTVHPGFLSPISFPDPQKVIEITKESVRHIDSIVQGLPIKVGIENMPDMIVTTCRKAKDVLYVIEGTDIGLCFDVGHAHTTGQTENFYELKDKFVNVHLHDNDGRSDSHMPLGGGTVDFDSVLRELSDYSGTYVLETRSWDDALSGKHYFEKVMAG